MVGWLVGLATGDVNMAAVVFLDHFEVPWGVLGGPWESLWGPWGSLLGGLCLGAPGGSLRVPGVSPGEPWEVPAVPQGFPRSRLGSLGGRWASLGLPRGRPRPPQGPPLRAMSVSKNIEKTIVFLAFPRAGQTLMVLGPPWGHPGGTLSLLGIPGAPLEFR